MSTANNEERLLSPREVALKCGRTTRTLWNWRQKGIGPPFVTINGRPQYRSGDVKKWMDALEVAES